MCIMNNYPCVYIQKDNENGHIISLIIIFTLTMHNNEIGCIAFLDGKALHKQLQTTQKDCVNLQQH